MEWSKASHRVEFPVILSATDNFDESLVIGRGGFGKVYKGTVMNGSSASFVAIKRLNATFDQGESEFLAEVEVLSNVRHRNIVSLFGYCTYEAEMIIVYEYMPNGTLQDHLHKLGTPLSWLHRLKICISAGRALDYLHTGVAVIHRDIKPSNIFLHESCAAKISGLGLSKIIPTNQNYVSAPVKGTFGYLDPYYFSTGRLTRKSDVYAFGVVLFEVLCRKRAVDSSLDNEQWGLATWAHDSIKDGNLKQIIDSSIRGEISPKCLKEFVRIAERCLHRDPKKRPTMAEVVVSLEFVLTLQEKMNSTQLAGQTIFGKMIDYIDMLPFSSNRRNSGGSYSRQNVKLPSTKSHEHTGDHGPISETFVDAISEESHTREKRLKQKMSFSNEKITAAIEPKGLKQKMSFSNEEITVASEPKCLKQKMPFSNEEITAASDPKGLKQKMFSKEDITAASEPKGLKQKMSFSYEEITPASEPKGLKQKMSFFNEEITAASEPKGLKQKMSFSNQEITATSEPIGLKQKMSFFNEEITPASEPNRKLDDTESGNQVESLSELMPLEYIQRADVLMRKKDLLHLIWLYSVKKETEVNFGSLVDQFSLLNEYIRKSTDSSRDVSYRMEIQILLHNIEEHLDDAAFDMVAFIPEELVENRSWYLGSLAGLPEIQASAVASATHRAVNCIRDLKVKKLGISGSGAEEIAKTLENMSVLRSEFDMVLCVRVRHYSIQELMNGIEEEIHIWRQRSSDNETVVMEQCLNCLLFIHCSDVLIDLHNPDFNLSKWFGSVQMVITSETRNAFPQVDMEIRLEDHLLPWILFSTNVDLAIVGKYPSIQKKAKRLIEKCHGHLLSIIILARALRGVVDVSAWELALQELASQNELSSLSSLSQLGVASDVMVRVLRFIWPRMESLSQRCIIQYASRYKESEFEKTLLINSWIKDGLVKNKKQGEHAFQDLIRSFLLERVGDNCVRMRNETRVTLIGNFVSRAHTLYLKQDGSESNQMLNAVEWDAREIHLSNNRIFELPNDPDCPILVSMFLHCNRFLIDIPITFFNNMPSLQALDISGTSIKCLPSSISKLTTLRKLFIKDCDLLMELPPEIGALKSLKVFDSEGTQLICLPEQFGLLTKLECLKFSLYNLADEHKQSSPSMQISTATILSHLMRLKELIICVDLYGEWWEKEVKLIINILPKFQNLESLRLYIPTTEVLAIFMETHSWRRVPIYQILSNFGFVVGHLQQRLITRVPYDLYKTFVKMPECLTYTNGEAEGDKEVIGSVLTNAKALFLDRHWTVRSLSAFGLTEMERLKFCLLAECDEMLEIVNGSHLDNHPISPVLGSLEHLSIHYMKSLTSILNRPIGTVCLPNLKTLTIHTCPELRTIFTHGLLDSLTCLEYLVVKNCSRIKSLVNLESDHFTSTPTLPSLKKISLLNLPELVSSCGIAPRLESLVVYNCPNLKELSYMEASGDHKEIKGEDGWWDALKWCEPEWPSGRPDYLVFISLGTQVDIMDELADAVNLLPHLGSGESTKEAQTGVITRPGPTDKGKVKI